MDRIIKPDKFDVLPSADGSGKKWKLWKRGFSYFLGRIEATDPDINKLEVLFLHLSADVADIIIDEANFDVAINKLDAAYVKPVNEIYARHILSTRAQKSEESVDEFLQSLYTLSADCKFKAVSASEHKSLSVRDAFIRGLRSSIIRTRLLENFSLTLDEAVSQARALEQAQKNSEAYSYTVSSAASTKADPFTPESSQNYEVKSVAAAYSKWKCFYCGQIKKQAIWTSDSQFYRGKIL